MNDGVGEKPKPYYRTFLNLEFLSKQAFWSINVTFASVVKLRVILKSRVGRKCLGGVDKLRLLKLKLSGYI